MPAHWETGVVVNTPTWHRLERAVLPEHITEWSVGLKEAGIDWEVYTDGVYVKLPDGSFGDPVADWQAIRRNDDHSLLSVQPKSLAVVPIAKFGEVVETIAGKGLKYEAIFSLYGGRMIVALLYFDEDLAIKADEGVTRNVPYLCMQQRFDGQGGIRGIPTTVRTICANTVNLAEALDGKQLGFNIRHTSNWEERVGEAARNIQTARRDSAIWVELANRLSVKLSPFKVDRYLEKFLPTSSDMTDRQLASVKRNRHVVKGLQDSITTAHLKGTAYGLVQASIEWADHIRGSRSIDSEVSRQLRKEPYKARAVRVACELADVKRKDVLAAVDV